MPLIDLAGMVFGKLTVLHLSENKFTKAGNLVRQWVCKCACGETITTSANKLRTGHTKSCGCLRRERRAALKHGYCVNDTIRSEYWAWHNAKRRCAEPDKHNYHRYGGRGISMCKEWRDDFSAFIAHIGPKPPSTTLDRIDNKRGYEPGNVRWATYKVQANNRDLAPKKKHPETCVRGHPWIVENLSFSIRGIPRCKICHREQEARRRAW